MKFRVVWIVSLAALGIVGLSVSLRAMQEASFPHERHQGLFPLCTGCHEGIPAGDVADYYPEATSCSGCHDGVREVRVAWRGPSERTDNLNFAHAPHAQALAAAGDPVQECASCHVRPGGGRMAVADEIQVPTCLGCHAHEASEHQVDATCTTCHVPLAESGFDLARIETIAPPPDHRAPAWAAGDHGRLVQEDASRCATCHTRERCVTCHVDADRAEIVAFPAAPSEMELPVRVAHYDAPSSHNEREWLSLHGAVAARSECVTCHTSNDCTSCHVQPAPSVIASLPSRDAVVAPGAQVTAHAPESHGRMFFSRAHATLAAAGDASCSTCHQESFCVSCHDAPMQGGYHPGAFLARHSASAFGRDADCATCHNAQAFCRQCHVESGLTPAGGGRLGPGYHDDGPVWLLRHGQGARQNLESCTTCHRQVDCVQCHGVLGAFKISPHTDNFDPQRAWARSPRTCLACHNGNPLR